jgi:hypothetical protein
VATITKANLRLPPRYNIYSKMAMEISTEGFSSVSGNVAANLIIERGMRCEFTGFHSSFNGRQTLDLIYGETNILEREAHDPAAIIAHKVSKTLNKTHIETVRRQFGEDWPQWLIDNPSLLDEPICARWRNSTKQALLNLAIELGKVNQKRLDLLTVGVSDKVIEKPIANRRDDAFLLVRQKKLSFIQADDGNKIGKYFCGTLPRATGALWDALREAENDGHSAMTVSDAREYLAREYGFSVTDINAGFESAYETHGLHEHGLHDTVKTLGERPRVIAFSENADCEKAILDTIEETRKDGVSCDTIIAPLPDKLDGIQKDAVRMALSNPISIITGGPGTGKTTICEAIVNQLELVIGIAVAARAARNLFERTGIQSMTVAKFLSEALQDNIGYYDALIIDEASMISSQYMRRILQSVRSAGIERVVFVGDCDQLPPVSWGAPFADLIEGDALPITTLRKIYRTKEGGGIARLSADIRGRKIYT